METGNQGHTVFVIYIERVRLLIYWERSVLQKKFFEILFKIVQDPHRPNRFPDNGRVWVLEQTDSPHSFLIKGRLGYRREMAVDKFIKVLTSGSNTPQIDNRERRTEGIWACESTRHMMNPLSNNKQ